MSAVAATPDTIPEQPVKLIIGAIASVLLLASLGQTIVGTALPTIVSELGGLDHLTWVVTAYLLSCTVVAPIYGKLGDLFGRKIVLQFAIIVFLIGAVLSAMSTSMTFLIIARTVQGLGGGGLMVVAMASVADVIPSRQRGRVQGLFGAVFGLATIIGPLIGGFFVQNLSWHWIFLINIPFGLIALAVIGVAFRVKVERKHHKIDYLGALLLTTTLSAVVLFTSLGGNTFAWSSPTILFMIALSVVALIAFIYVESKAAEPILPLSLFSNQTFVVSGVVLFIVGLCMFGAFTFLPLFLQMVRGATPLESGLQIVPTMLGLLVASTFSGQFMTRTGRYKILLIGGTALLVVGLLLMSTMDRTTDALHMSIYMFIFGLGIGPNMTVAITATQNSVPPDVIGVATAGTTLFRQVGGSLGVSVFGAIFSSRLAVELGSAIPDGNFTAAFSPDAIAGLPAATQQALLDGFTNALHPVFFVAACAGVLAFLLSFMLKELPLDNAQSQKPDALIDGEPQASAAAVGTPALVSSRS